MRGDLFRAFTMRLSFKKEQHVRLLKKIEDKNLANGKVMDVLDIYFNVLENNSGIKEN